MTNTNLYTYLIKHIDFDIDIDFVKDFYHIQKNKTKYNVDLDLVVKWLDAKRENLIDTLKSNYEENDDYIVKIGVKSKKNDWGGSKKKSYYLTSECFKLLSLRSNAKNGEKIRKYYIKLEEIVDHYKDGILELYNHDQAVKKLNKGIYPRKPGIYIIREITHVGGKKVYRYKLGRTNNLKNRMQVYNTGSSDNVDLVFFEELIQHKLIEKCIKYGLKKYEYRKNKEFYDCSVEKIQDMIKSCMNFHNDKLVRPPTSNKLQIQFTYVKSGFDRNKIIHLELEDNNFEPNHDTNEYNDHWSSENVDIFSNINIFLDTYEESNRKYNKGYHINHKGGNITFDHLYRNNKYSYMLLSNLIV